MRYPISRVLERKPPQMPPGRPRCVSCGSRIRWEVTDYLGAGGLLGLDPRSEQIQIAGQLSEFLQGSGSRLAIIEAGTGTGKTFAYLSAACAEAQLQGGDIVISTATRGLQAQLINDTLPAMQACGALPDFMLIEQMGRTNYACLLNVEECEDEGRIPSGTLRRMLEDPLEQLLIRGDAVHADIRLRKCVGQECPFAKKCRYRRNLELRMAAESSTKPSITITNHASLCSFAGKGADIIIVDEAHKLMDYVRNSKRQELRLDIKDLALGREVRAQIEPAYNGFIAWARRANHKRTGITWTVQGRQLLHNLKRVVMDVSASDPAFLTRLSGAEGNTTGGAPDPAISLRTALPALSELAAIELLRGGSSDPDAYTAHYIAWVDEDAGVLSLDTISASLYSIVPLRNADVSALDTLEAARILRTSPKTILCSATLLDSEGSTESLDREFGLSGLDRETKVVIRAGTPFRYHSNVVAYVEEDARLIKSYPATDQWFDDMADRILDCAEITGGRALVLCASRDDMQKLSSRCMRSGFRVITQGRDAAYALRTYRGNLDHRPILFGLASFWEGVSLPGSELFSVIIPRVPFANRNNPVDHAREQRVPQNLRFKQLTFEPAVRDLRQGCGRLIRTTRDVGMLFLLDPRLRSKRWGPAALGAIPQLVSGRNVTYDLQQAAAWWSQLDATFQRRVQRGQIS